MRSVVVAALAGGALVAVPAASAAPPDAIRVGGPSKPEDAKVAIVASKARLAGRTFRVLDAQNRTVLRGKLKKAPGSSAPWRNAAVADLGAVRAEGRFRVAVGALRSRAWIVRATGSADAIVAMLGYFAANSDGAEPSPIHGPAHLTDAVVASGPHTGQRFDFTGGWMDAGDMTHFTKTTAFAAIALQLAARLDPANAALLNSHADVGVRWLVKAHPAPDLFIQQLADTRDHDVGFRDPAADAMSSRPGIGQRLAYPGMGSDVGGKAAAALALAALRADAAGRAPLLQQAREWYAAGQAADRIAPRPEGLVGEYVYNDADEGSGDDDLATAAALLWRLTGEPDYLEDARRDLPGISTEPFTWAETGLLAAAELCGGAGLSAVPDEGLRNVACDKLRAGAARAASVAKVRAFPVFGVYQWGTTATNAAGAAVAGFAARAGQLPAGYAMADGGRDWLLGRNPWGVSFVVGYGPGAPRHPHHWAVAYKGPGHPRGAVVGGPAPRASVDSQKKNFTPRFRERPFNSTRLVYEDNAGNYVNSEPAIDYTAAAILNLAVAG